MLDNVKACPPLPPEVIEQILRHVSDQHLLYACSLTSRSWYDSAIPLLYRHPQIGSRNFNAFATVICPSKNPHIRRNGLAELVRVLDMSKLVYNSKKSLTARLLSRTKYNLEEFVAPQATFGINSFSSLSKCNKLRVLNLSWVTEAIPTRSIFDLTLRLPALQMLYLPNAYTSDNEFSRAQFYSILQSAALIPLPSAHMRGGCPDIFMVAQIHESQGVSYNMPPHLTTLYMAGSVDNVKLFAMRHMPPTVRTVGITSCPRIDLKLLYWTLFYARERTKITKLIVGPNVGTSESRALPDYLGPMFPPLRHLRSLTLECCKMRKFIHMVQGRDISGPSPFDQIPDCHFPKLQSLTVTMWDSESSRSSFGPKDISRLINNRHLPALCLLRVDKKMRWQSHEEEQPTSNLEKRFKAARERKERSVAAPNTRLETLDELLKNNAMEMEERRMEAGEALDETDLGISCEEAGVVFITTTL